MDTLQEFIDWLVEHCEYAGEDRDVFRHILPASPDDVVCIYEYSGEAPPLFDDASTKMFQVVVRRKTHTKASREARRIQKVLRSESPVYIRLDTMDCPLILKDTPFKLKIDEKNRVLYAFNMGITSID